MKKFRVVENQGCYLVKTKDGCILAEIRKIPEAFPAHQDVLALIETIKEKGMAEPENPPAFPKSGVYTHEGNNVMEYGQDGMTLRDYLIAHAPFNVHDAILYLQSPCEQRLYVGEDIIETLAKLRIGYADKILKERIKK